MEFQVLEKALNSLNAAISQGTQSELERDGTIQRFEYTFELLWKVAKRVLNQLGIVSVSPRSVIRDLAQQSMIEDVELWMSFLLARNYTSHTYDESVAKWVFGQIPEFALRAEDLVMKLKLAVQNP